MHVYMHLMTKVISISDDAYTALKSIKSDDESFTKIILKLTKRHKNEGLLELAGALEDESFADEVVKIYNDRQKVVFRAPSFDGD